MEKPAQDLDHWKSVLWEPFSEYASAASAFAIPALIGDLPMETVMIVGTFLFVGGVSSVLFNRLNGVRTLPKSSKWTDFTRSVVFGGLLGAASVSGPEYFNGIGMGGAVVAGVIVSLMDVAWRQRVTERRLYRETLLQPET